MLTGSPAVHRDRSHGVGALPYRQKAGAAERAAREYPGRGLGHHHETARQDTPRIAIRPRAASSTTCGAASPHGRRGAGSTTSRSANTTCPTGSSFREALRARARRSRRCSAPSTAMVTGGTPELVLVSGYSGIGKSSVVNELHKVLVPPRGLFASGKFDQYKRDIPYATLAQAFQSLVRYLLGKSDAELSGWRDALAEALGPNGRLMIDLVPELKLIIGDQPPVPELSPQDARRRFQVVFRRFIGVFARREHPLALFLDDLQWLDAATLDLLEDLLTPPGVPHLMLIGAYRDNEVTAAHPLTRKLEAIRNAGANVHEIALAPLACEDVRQLVADALRCEPERADPLAQLVHEKTAGNPFFTDPVRLFARRRRHARRSIMLRHAGPGISSAFTPRVTPTTWWTSWSGS